MDANFTFDLVSQEKRYQVRKVARKLAKNKSKDRVVRKLPQTVVIVPLNRTPTPVGRVRKTLNRQKRLVYMMLIGASLSALVYDADESRVGSFMSFVNHASEQIQKIRGV